MLEAAAIALPFYVLLVFFINVVSAAEDDSVGPKNKKHIKLFSIY